MTEEDFVILCFYWLAPNGALGVIIGFSEKFGYELQGCEPNLASWLRYGIFQYMLIFFMAAYLIYMPSKYSIYFDRFLNRGMTSFTLAFVFVAGQIFAPWITLVLYLRLRKACGERISASQGVFYWILFGMQVLVFLIASVTMYFFIGVLKEIRSGYRDKQSKKRYSEKVISILDSNANQRSLYAELLKEAMRYQVSLFRVDLEILRLVQSRKLDVKCVETLKAQHRTCFRCKSGFEVGEKVNFLELCCHLAHWECFISALAHNGQCSECKQSSVHALKRSIASGPLGELEKLIAIPPCIKPNSAEQNRAAHAMPINAQPRPIVTIEHFNYTVDQKTGGEPAEALPAPVAETEI